MWLLGCLSGIVLVVLLGGLLLWSRFHCSRRRDPERLAGTSCPGVRAATARMRVILRAARRAGLCSDLPPAWACRLGEVLAEPN